MARRDDLRREDVRGKTSAAEKAVTAASLLLTLALFAYVGWQGWTAPAEGEPEAMLGTVEATPEGDALVTVHLVNHARAGLREAGVEVHCGDAPIEVQFQHVPAEGRRSATVRCPPGTIEPRVEVAYWIQA